MSEDKNKVDQKKLDSEIGQALFSDTERFEMWFSAYWKPAAAIAGFIAIAVAVIFWIVSAGNAAEKKAAFALADANSAEELAAVLKKNPDHKGAVIARFRLASMLVEAKKYKEAIKEFDTISASGTTDPILAAKAKIAAAYASELAGDIKDAASRFLAVESNLQLSAPERAEAGYCAGRLLIQSKDFKQAKAVLSRTSLLGSQTAAVGYWTENAKQALVALENGEYASKTAVPAKKAVKKAPAAAVKK